MKTYSSLIFSTAPWERLHAFLENQKYSAIHVLADDQTETYCLPILKENLQHSITSCFVIQSGESSKSLESCIKIWEHLLHQNPDRNTLIICLGGGVITDLGGFCASVLLRGMDTLYIPTSLMAMADAAIGGKTAVNFEYYKNQIGSFHAPPGIVIDYRFLTTLPDRHMRNGFVEIIKHSLISSPSYWWDITNLTWPLSPSVLQDFIKKSIRTKTEIVEKDYLENGSRKVLNFGHTIGHALESFCMANGQDVLHGEAIAVGIICESFLSGQRYRWKTHVVDQIKTILKPFTGTLKFTSDDYPEIVKFLNADKKKQNREVRFSLIEQIGQPNLNQRVTEEELLNSLDYYNLS